MQSRPWGVMHEFASGELLVKVITVYAGQRTSLQYHHDKDELMIIIGGTGHVEIDGFIHDDDIHRIKPGTIHRVTGPLHYLELSTNDPDDTIRIEDDYGRMRDT